MSVPAHCWGEEGGRLTAYGGRDLDLPHLAPGSAHDSRPPPARLPLTGTGRKGKGGGLGGRTLGFPQPLQEELGFWGYSRAGFSSMGSSYFFRKRRLLPTRVAPTWSFLTLTDSVFSFGFCRQALP